MTDLDEAALETAIEAYDEEMIASPARGYRNRVVAAAIRAYLAALTRIDEAELDVVIYEALPDYVLSMPKAMIIRKAVMAYLATVQPERAMLPQRSIDHGGHQQDAVSPGGASLADPCGEG